MADLLNLGLNAASGGIFGIAGTILGRVAGYFEQKQYMKHEIARWGHEYKLHELNMRARAQETELELDILQEQGSWQGLAASIEADGKNGSASQWVINILRLVRPCLTFLLWLITGWIYYLEPSAGMTEAVTFAATAATLWWFGDRAPKPQRKL